MNLDNEVLFVEKYRPRKIEDCILPDELKKTFRAFIDKGEIPNLLLVGKPGIGKTTVAKALMHEMGFDYIVINGSLDGNIDTLRYKIKDFASSVSMTGVRKFVIVDEADYLNPTSTQPAFRNFIETYSKNCGFIFTANYFNKIAEPLHSRLNVITFKVEKKEKEELGIQMYKRAMDILKAESISFDKKVLAEVVHKHFPDFRATINALQRYGASGHIDSGILVNLDEENFNGLVKLLKGKDFAGMRKWVGENLDTDPTQLMRKFYDKAHDKVKPDSIPMMVILLSKYQYQAGFVADQEINLVAMLTEFLVDVEFS